jgi:hypothetical protein
MERLEELLGNAPELRRELDHQRRAVAVIRSVDLVAPSWLRARVESLAKWSHHA